ncbi:hypothetical protein EJ03DRAFT_199014 [Teratosphaeria nubilosa]|uniref:Uncharacterized protein n=1 Tax=Teratosphaeria nubilosa TaxID=161662 RepID=A0A6G1KYH8_9PEZI|nr:hypothetical protein EJ03DRAFT_199014 [Teratosphaeria nubilosa]
MMQDSYRRPNTFNVGLCGFSVVISVIHVQATLHARHDVIIVSSSRTLMSGRESDQCQDIEISKHQL